MTSDLDIYRSAQVLVRLHGDSATHEAIRKADALMKVGDAAGVATWLRILEAIKTLQRRQPPKGSFQH